jgi:hypothetical protein
VQKRRNDTVLLIYEGEKEVFGHKLLVIAFFGIVQRRLNCFLCFDGHFVEVNHVSS